MVLYFLLFLPGIECGICNVCLFFFKRFLVLVIVSYLHTQEKCLVISDSSVFTLQIDTGKDELGNEWVDSSGVKGNVWTKHSGIPPKCSGEGWGDSLPLEWIPNLFCYMWKMTKMCVFSKMSVATCIRSLVRLVLLSSHHLPLKAAVLPPQNVPVSISGGPQGRQSNPGKPGSMSCFWCLRVCFVTCIT